MAGILAVRAGWAVEVLAGTVLLAAAARLMLRIRPHPVFIGSLLGGMLLGHAHTSDPHPLWRRLPPREVTCSLRVDELFNARKPDRAAGTGTLLRTDIPHDTVSGRRTAFYLGTESLGGRLPVPGEVLECHAVLTFLPRLLEPDDYQLYLLGRDIRLSLARGTMLRSLRPAPWLEQRRQELFAAAREILTTACDEPEDPGNVLASMLLGSRALLTDERIELYRKTGSYHLFAVSGLHVGGVALCLHLLCGLLRMPVVWRMLPALAGTWGYVWLTGASPSAVRAGIMISCMGACRWLLRQPHIFPALALSAWIVLLIDPMQLFHLGFQLSYSVVGSILLVGLPLARHLREHWIQRPWHVHQRPRWRLWLDKLKGWSLDLVCVSASASLGSMPLIIQHFDLFTPGGTLFGILLNPLATLVVMAGCVALLLGLLPAGVAGGWIAIATWPFIRSMEWLLLLCLAVPGSVGQRSWPWPHTGNCLVGLVLCCAWLLQYLRQRGIPLPAAFYLLPHALVIACIALVTVHT
jgi:competence protein ComEC